MQSNSSRRSLLYRLCRAAVIGAAAGLGGLTACQHKLIYLPSKYEPGVVRSFELAGGQRLEFTTSQGRQTAWLQPAADGAVPEHVWIVCGGNASLALDYSFLHDEPGLKGDAFVYFDYPGYGICEGSPNPDRIRESLDALGPMITERCRLPAGALAERGLVFGHSLGAAVTLMAAEKYGIRRAVLIAPFTSTMEMTRVLFPVSLGWLVTHRFDNHRTLASLMARGGHAWIFHGDSDTVIPVRMGRGLAAESGAGVTFMEVKDAGHNNMLDRAWPDIEAAMKAARK